MKKPLLSLLFFFLGCLLVSAQLNEKEKILFKAMNDEMKRSKDSLRLPDSPPPYFIQYTVRNGTYCNIESKMGAVIKEEVAPMSLMRVNIIVGDDELTNINLTNSGFQIPCMLGQNADLGTLDLDYNETRRRL